MGDDLEAMLAADEAAIDDEGFAARVTEVAREGRWLRRGWLAAAGAIGAGAAGVGVVSLTSNMQGALAALTPAELVVSLPVADLAWQVPSGALLSIAVALAMGVAVAAAKLASDEF